MAKRTRGTTRPGQRRPPQRQPGRPAVKPASRPAEGLSVEEEARAAELEAQIVAQERDAERARNRGRDARRDLDATPRGRGQSLIDLKAAEEYSYVVRDVRRIVQVGGAMVAVMLVVFALQVAGVIKI